MISPNVSAGLIISTHANERVFSYVAHPPETRFWYDKITFTQSRMRSSGTGAPATSSPSASSASAAFRPSDEQSEMGQPWSRVLNGHAPLEMWRYHFRRSPGQSSRTCESRTYRCASRRHPAYSRAKPVAATACAANAQSQSCEPLYPCIFMPSSASQR